MFKRRRDGDIDRQVYLRRRCVEEEGRRVIDYYDRRKDEDRRWPLDREKPRRKDHNVKHDRRQKREDRKHERREDRPQGKTHDKPVDGKKEKKQVTAVPWKRDGDNQQRDARKRGRSHERPSTAPRKNLRIHERPEAMQQPSHVAIIDQHPPQPPSRPPRSTPACAWKAAAEAAAAGFEVQHLDNGLAPCGGFHGRPCRWRQQIRPKKQKCKTCWALQEKPLPADLPDPWQMIDFTGDQAAPSQPPPASTSPSSEDLALAATEEIALELARRGEDGFRGLQQILRSPLEVPVDQSEWPKAAKLLHRLALLADPDIFPNVKMASHCGGIKPDPPFVYPCKHTAHVADAGNDCYHAVVSRLYWKCESWIASRPTKDKDRLSFLKGLSKEHRGDVVEVALAAADYAWKQQENAEWTWKTLEGGVWGHGDLLLVCKWFRNLRMLGYQPDKRVRLSLNQGGDV